MGFAEPRNVTFISGKCRFYIIFGFVAFHRSRVRSLPSPRIGAIQPPRNDFAVHVRAERGALIVAVGSAVD
jgi:hypothetical protein